MYNKKSEDELKKQDYMNWLLGKYLSYSFNAPNKYPNKPYMESSKREGMTDEEMERIINKNRIILETRFNGNTGRRATSNITVTK